MVNFLGISSLGLIGEFGRIGSHLKPVDQEKKIRIYLPKLRACDKMRRIITGV